MSEFSDLSARGMREYLAALGETFTWNSHAIACSINHEASVVTAARSDAAFTDGLPEIGDTITVAGREVQIKKRGNASLSAIPGGYTEDVPFVDDPADPAIDFQFSNFSGR